MIHTEPGRFFGARVHWELGSTPDSVHLDAVLYRGEDAAFDFSDEHAIELAAELEFVARGRSPATDALTVTAPEPGVADVAWGDLRLRVPALQY